MLKITILISKDYDIDIYKISRYIAKMIVLLNPNHNHECDISVITQDRGRSLRSSVNNTDIIRVLVI